MKSSLLFDRNLPAAVGDDTLAGKFFSLVSGIQTRVLVHKNS